MGRYQRQRRKDGRTCESDAPHDDGHGFTLWLCYPSSRLQTVNQKARFYTRLATMACSVAAFLAKFTCREILEICTERLVVLERPV
jgi:hypothetical protein